MRSWIDTEVNVRTNVVLLGMLMALPAACGREEAAAPEARAAQTTAAETNAAEVAEQRAPAQPAAAAEPNAATRPATQPSETAQQRTVPEPVPEQLYGTWVAQNVDSKIGQVKIELTFKKEGPVHLLAWSELPLVGQVRNKTAPYEVTNGKLHSDALRGGTTVDYWFEGGNLMIKYKEGQVVRFTKTDAP